MRKEVCSKEQHIRDNDVLLNADKTVHDLHSMYDEYHNIRWNGAKDHFAAAHADKPEQYKNVQWLLHKFVMLQPIDRKAPRTEKTQFEQEIEACSPI